MVEAKLTETKQTVSQQVDDKVQDVKDDLSENNLIFHGVKEADGVGDRDYILQLCKSFVRPRLEYCIQAWCSHLRNEIDLQEKMQRRTIQLIYSLHDLPDHVRLKRTTLVTRRLRGDLFDVFKIIKGLEDVNSNTFLRWLLLLTLEVIHLN